MKICLVGLSSKLLNAWYEYFGNEENVSIVEEDITTTDCNAIVSPANSFGFMDGGLDLALSKRFGWDLQIKLQAKIKDLPERELLIGKALVMETNDAKVPYLISAPTMRVPTDFNIATSINAYLAMKAILIEAKCHPKISSIAIPGLCTGVGKMQPLIAANQMYSAYKEIILEQNIEFKNFTEAKKYHWQLNPEAVINGI